MDFSTLPLSPEYSSKAARGRVAELLNRKKVHQTTFDKWRRETNLSEGWLTEEQVWMLAVYGRCMQQYRNAEKALKKANEIINEARNQGENNEQQAA